MAEVETPSAQKSAEAEARRGQQYGVEFPFTISVVPGSIGVAEDRERIVALSILAAVLVSLAVSTIAYLVLRDYRGDMRRYTSIAKAERFSGQALRDRLQGILPGRRLVRITDPDAARTCTGRLVRDNASPRCYEVSEGRWCPNKCEK